MRSVAASNICALPAIYSWRRAGVGVESSWDGRHFIEENADGTRLVYFRVQFVDFDMSTGKVREKWNACACVCSEAQRGSISACCAAQEP